MHILKEISSSEAVYEQFRGSSETGTVLEQFRNRNSFEAVQELLGSSSGTVQDHFRSSLGAVQEQSRSSSGGVQEQIGSSSGAAYLGF